MIYITGDSHGLVDFDRLKYYFEDKKVSLDDYLIILGDAGILWQENDNHIENYSSLGLTILYIDGNHENFDLLNKCPIVTKLNAKMHQINDHIFHILRGEILEIDGIKMLCIGGATSIDRIYRMEHVSWWEDEHIKYEDIDNAIINLNKYDFKVDYILTHCAPALIVYPMLGFIPDKNTNIILTHYNIGLLIYN